MRPVHPTPSQSPRLQRSELETDRSGLPDHYSLTKRGGTGRLQIFAREEALRGARPYGHILIAVVPRAGRYQRESWWSCLGHFALFWSTLPSNMNYDAIEFT